MGAFKFIPKEIREQILARIKNGGVSVAQAAEEAGVNPRTVYHWLRSKTVKDGGILEINRLRRENKELCEIIGRLSIELSKAKKN